MQLSSMKITDSNRPMLIEASSSTRRPHRRHQLPIGSGNCGASSPLWLAGAFAVLLVAAFLFLREDSTESGPTHLEGGEEDRTAGTSEDSGERTSAPQLRSDGSPSERVPSSEQAVTGDGPSSTDEELAKYWSFTRPGGDDGLCSTEQPGPRYTPEDFTPAGVWAPGEMPVSDPTSPDAAIGMAKDASALLPPEVVWHTESFERVADDPRWLDLSELDEERRAEAESILAQYRPTLEAQVQAVSELGQYYANLQYEQGDYVVFRHGELPPEVRAAGPNALRRFVVCRGWYFDATFDPSRYDELASAISALEEAAENRRYSLMLAGFTP